MMFNLDSHRNSKMTNSGEIMEKPTETRYACAANQRKNIDQEKSSDTKEVNIGDGWSIRVVNRGGKSNARHLRT